jgi:hypothetical protein
MEERGRGRFDTPLWRLAGAVVSWSSFTFFFLGLAQAAAVVMGLGGFCASGGPYVIETECPEAVILFAPLGSLGMFASAAIALIFARGFGVSLVTWAWPILFIGLGSVFFNGAADGQNVISNVLLGVMFVVMGVVPVWFVINSKALAPTIAGSRSLEGARFVYDGKPRRYLGLTPTEGDAVPPTVRDWGISLGLWVVSVAAGGWLSLLAFNAVGSAE